MDKDRRNDEQDMEKSQYRSEAEQMASPPYESDSYLGESDTFGEQIETPVGDTTEDIPDKLTQNMPGEDIDERIYEE